MKTFLTARRDLSLRRGMLADTLDCTTLADWPRKVVYPAGTECYYRKSISEPLMEGQLRVYLPVTVNELEWLDPVPAEAVQAYVSNEDTIRMGVGIADAQNALDWFGDDDPIANDRMKKALNEVRETYAADES